MVTHWIPWCLVEDNLSKFGIVMLELLFLYFSMEKRIIQKIRLVPFTKHCLFFPKTVYGENFFFKELNCICSCKLERKDALMKYNPSVKLCHKHYSFQLNIFNYSFKALAYILLDSTFITYYPHKTQENKIHLILYSTMLNSVRKQPEFAFNASLTSVLS